MFGSREGFGSADRMTLFRVISNTSWKILNGRISAKGHSFAIHFRLRFYGRVFMAPILYSTHRAVIFAIAQLSYYWCTMTTNKHALSSRLFWPRTSVPRRRRRRHTSAGPRRSSTAATLFHRQIVCRSTHTQHIRRQELRCRRATCLEQSSGPLARRGHYIQHSFRRELKKFLF